MTDLRCPGISGASAPASLKQLTGAESRMHLGGISGASAPASLKRMDAPLSHSLISRYFRGIRPGLIEARLPCPRPLGMPWYFRGIRPGLIEAR